MRIECTARLTPDQLHDWQDFLASAQRVHPEQDARFADVRRADDLDVVYAMGWVGQELRAVGMFELRRHPFLSGHHVHALASSGPVCDTIDDLISFSNALVKHEAFRRVGAVRLTPYWLEDSVHLSQSLKDNGWGRHEPENERQTGLVDLTETVDDIMARFSKTCRQKLRQAERQDLTTESVQDAQTALEILRGINQHHRDRGLSEIPEKTFLVAFEHVYRTDDLGTILLVRHQGRFVGAIMLHRSRDTMHPMHSMYNEQILPELGNLRIVPFLLLQGIKWAKARGCLYVNVEGYKWPVDASDPLYNIYKYKKDFAPTQVLRIAGHQRVANYLSYLTGDPRSTLRHHVKPLKRHVKSVLKQWKINRENANTKAD
jgi:hypothetical protein